MTTVIWSHITGLSMVLKSAGWRNDSEKLFSFIMIPVKALKSNRAVGYFRTLLASYEGVHLERHPHRALTALASDPRISVSVSNAALDARIWIAVLIGGFTSRGSIKEKA